MKALLLPFAFIGLASLSACVAPVGPVEVTRFHLENTASLGQGSITVEPAPGQQGESLEFQSYAAAISRELSRIGYTSNNSGSDQIAILSVERSRFQPARNGSPVSVGLGGSTGNYGSGVGLGIGLDLSGPPPEMIETRISVMIRDKASDQTLWEGRASFTAKASSPLSQTQLGAAKMAEALFRDFPGQSGETILVK